MLMTGRYSLENKKERKIEVGREPHLGSMFKKAGYTTSIFGKSQPLKTHTENVIFKNVKSRHNKMLEWRKNLVGNKFDARKDDMQLFFEPGNYYQIVSEIHHFYDYSFSSGSPCCEINGFFENAQQTEPFTKWAVQRFYPEDGKTQLMKNAYVAAPFMEEETFGDKIQINYPRSMVAQASFDTRNTEQTVSSKLNDFIRSQEGSEAPFFAYYGLREGHGPFNTPERFRNTTSAGVIGEMIAETDEIVGKLFETLQETGIIDDTLIVFMSDNGAGTNYEPVVLEKFGFSQNAVDLGGEKFKLRGGKGYQHEGGTRLPFMWWYPKGFRARTIEDKPVSYVDVFRTLADLAQYNPTCNEGPDSRSLLPILRGESDEIAGPKEVLTHAVHVAPQAIRIDQWKLIPGSNEFFDISKDPAELNNLYEVDWAQRIIAALRSKLVERMARIAEREETTNNGQFEICPSRFAHF
jgi:arylsulfatase A